MLTDSVSIRNPDFESMPFDAEPNTTNSVKFIAQHYPLKSRSLLTANSLRLNYPPIIRPLYYQIMLISFRFQFDFISISFGYYEHVYGFIIPHTRMASLDAVAIISYAEALCNEIAIEYCFIDAVSPDYPPCPPCLYH